MAPIEPSKAMDGVAGHPRPPLVLPVLAVVASCAAMIMLAGRADDWTLDYGVGIVPAVAPWLTACLSVVAAVLSLNGRFMSSAGGSLLLGALVVAAAWSVVILPFDALRVVGLVPLPVSAWGASMRLLLLAGSACALLAGLMVRRTSRVRCAACGRGLPGGLDWLPRWPAGVAVAAALVYPALRACWALGGTFGTPGEPLDMDIAVAWGPAIAGAALVAFAVALFVGMGPLWVRALLGLGGVVLGLLLAMAGGLGAARAATVLATEGPQSVLPDAGLMTWTFVVVYGSWFVAGVGIIAGGWRFWAHRRDACPACRTFLGTS
jgi:hypothetical protein